MEATAVEELVLGFERAEDREVIEPGRFMDVKMVYGFGANEGPLVIFELPVAEAGSTPDSAVTSDDTVMMGAWEEVI